MKIIKWLLGAGAVLAFLLMLTHIAALCIEGIATRKVIGVICGFCGWQGFAYLYRKREANDG